MADKKQIKNPETQLLEQIFKSFIKPEIKMDLIENIFNPDLRPKAFKILTEKLV